MFLAGDVSGHRPLLHEASDEGRIAGANVAGLENLTSLHQLLHQVQTQARTRWLLQAIAVLLGPIEAVEYALGILLGYSRSLVCYGKPYRSPWRGVADGVVHQVGDAALERVRLDRDGEPALGVQVDDAALAPGHGE